MSFDAASNGELAMASWKRRPRALGFVQNSHSGEQAIGFGNGPLQLGRIGADDQGHDFVIVAHRRVD